MAAYTPYGACREVIHTHEPEALISGPAGTGKSLACLWKLLILADGVPGCRLLIVRKTRASLTETILVTWETKVLTTESPIVQGASRQFRHSYKFPNKSEVIVAGMDKPERIMSGEFDVIYVAEATELFENDWELLTSRLRNNVVPYQQIMADCNPSAPTHWLKHRCDAGKCKMLESRHEDNPTLYDHKHDDWTEQGLVYLNRLDALSGVRRERLRYGRWVAAEGVVYDGWDTRTHLVDRFDVPLHWRRIRAIDFGYSNPFVCLWIAIDGDGRMYVYRYTYRTQQLVSDHAEEIKRLTLREHIECTICDHDAEGNATLRRHGIPTRNAEKSIHVGIEAVQSRLRVCGDGYPRLFVMRDSLVNADTDLMDSKRPYTLEQEFDSYAWPKSVEGKPVKELPVDVDNHALDALRYAVMYVDKVNRVRMPLMDDDDFRESRKAALRRI